MIVVISCIFFLVRLTPGNPFSSDRVMNEETLESLERMYGMDKPLIQQYYDYIRGLLRLDFGMSYKHIGTRINSIIFKDFDSGFWLSIRFGIIVIVITVICGVLLGFASVLNPGGLLDKFVNLCSIIGIAIPVVIIAPMLVLTFAVKWRFFATSQWAFDMYHLTLPVIALSIPNVCTLAQIQRTSLIDVMNSPFINTARAKGLGFRDILIKHALKPSLIPVISFLGPASASILAGTVVIEKTFGFPGMGTLTVNAAIDRDYSMVLALVAIYSVLLITFNIIVDILYGFIDPKVRIK